MLLRPVQNSNDKFVLKTKVCGEVVADMTEFELITLNVFEAAHEAIAFGLVEQ